MDILPKELFEIAARRLHPDDFQFFIEYYDYLFQCGYSMITIEDGEIYIE